jgi:hypothetical protein
MSDLTTVGDVDLASSSPEDERQLEKELGVGEDQPRKSESQDDGDDHEDDDRSTKGDQELDDAQDDAAREAIKERRRNERQRRKQNRVEKVETLERSVESLAAQNRKMAEELMRLTQSDSSAKLGQLDAAISEADSVFNHYKTLHAEAVTKSDGATAAQAMDLMLKARDRHTQLTGVKESFVQSSRQPAPIDPRVRKSASDFAAKNAWYKGPQAADPDSQVMTMLDNSIAREGFDPTSQEYWSELESRAKKYLPHRFSATNSGDQDDGYNRSQERKPRTPVAGASQRGSQSSDSEGGFKLSTERVKAMKEAGIWDDPARRQKMIASYRKIDRDNA